VMASNGFICAVSSSKPAGKFNDQKMWNDEREYLTNVSITYFIIILSGYAF